MSKWLSLRPRVQSMAVMGGGATEINSVCPAITPTLGAELLTDGGLENWTTATNLTSWNEFAAAGSSVNREDTILHSGAHSARLDIGAAGLAAEIYQELAVAVGDYVQVSFWMYASAPNKSAQVKLLSGASGLLRTPSTTWTQYVDVLHVGTLNQTLEAISGVAASSSLYFDDITANKITGTGVLIGNRANRPGNYQCTPIVALATITGIDVCYADANNFVRATVDRSAGKAILTSRIGGTYAEVTSGSIAYGNGKILKVVIAANGTDFSLYYDSAQVGTTQAIVMNGMGYGIYGFNTFAGNTVGVVTTSNP